jgi:hypothetical protein
MMPPTTEQLRDLAMRVLLTAAQTVLAVLATVEVTDLSLSLLGTIGLAVAAAAITAIKGWVALMLEVGGPTSGWADTAWRALWTGLQAGLAVLALAPATSLVDVDVWQGAAVAAAAAVFSLAKSVAAELVGRYAVS